MPPDETRAVWYDPRTSSLPEFTSSMKARPEDLAVLLLRIAGLSLATLHGFGKVSSLAGGQGDRFIQGVASMGFPAPAVFAWAAALSEFVGGLCVALGLRTRVAAAFCAATMFVAGFVRHQAHRQLLHGLGLAPMPEETLKVLGSPELALAYLIAFAAIALLGGGRFAVDRLFGRKG